MKYILGIDIGTTAIKGAVIGEDGKIYGTQTSEYSLDHSFYRRSGS